MARNFNLTIIIGVLTAAPELRVGKTGIRVLKMSLAINKAYKDKNGEWQNTVTFVPVIAYNDIADNMDKALGKGDTVTITGQLQTESWTSKEGLKRSRMIVKIEKFFLMRVPKGHLLKKPEDDPGETRLSTPSVDTKDKTNYNQAEVSEVDIDLSDIDF